MGKHLASNKTEHVLSVGKRVVANFTRTSASQPINKGYKLFVPGVIGEAMTRSNRQRYLVFCDDGNVEYLTNENILAVVEQSENVWEDVHVNLGAFIKDYLTRETSKQRS